MKAAATENSSASVRDKFLADGFEIIEDVLPLAKCDSLAKEISALHQSKRAGLRNLLRTSPTVSELANSLKLTSLLSDRLGKVVFPVRALFFDKTPQANWRVAWHQDLTIAVEKKIETRGFTAWSVKDEVIHVQPPAEILEKMATVRLHLDPATAENGALEIIPRSHLNGKLDADAICVHRNNTNVVKCEAAKGTALFMRPLSLHSSRPAVNPSHRRVLHIEYATDELPNGLKWFDQ